MKRQTDNSTQRPRDRDRGEALSAEQAARLRRQKRSKRRSAIVNVILVLILLAGIGIMAYPTFSDWWNSFHQSRAIASYANVVEATDTELMDRMLAEAHAYNEAILDRQNAFVLSDEELKQYESLLDISGTGVMGYIQIPSINVNIPIYHGTDEAVLQIAIGHIEWSSLPVGGESTHAVVSGHRGLPSARLFTDLDKLKEKDTFTVTVLNQTLTYEVDQIRIVLPHETEDLMLKEGEDYCTLVTCTPYGVNSHRMLVRGHRIFPEAVKKTVVVLPDGLRIPNYIAIPAVGIPLLFLFLLGMIVYYRRKPRPVREEEILRQLAELEEKP